MISEYQLKQQVRLLKSSVRMLKRRSTALRDALDEAVNALEHSLLSIVVDEVKRSTYQAIHQARRKIDDDVRRYSALDNT